MTTVECLRDSITYAYYTYPTRSISGWSTWPWLRFYCLNISYFSTSLFSRSLDATNVTTTCQAIAVSDFEDAGTASRSRFATKCAKGIGWLYPCYVHHVLCSLAGDRVEGCLISRIMMRLGMAKPDIRRYQSHATTQASQTNPAPKQSTLLTHHHSTTAMYRIRDATFLNYFIRTHHLHSAH